jgi:DNA polymerase III epsilon subunit-like protein
VDVNLREVYDSLVKPEGQILDYNTRWSGLTEDSLKNCTKNLKNVQSELLKLLDKNSILIGHSLESDFNALKLIHKNVIDTSVVFPHKMGPPLKRALKNLMSEYLQRIIQEDSEGHDSKEDATACVQLMIWKINEDLKNKSNAKKFNTNFKLTNVKAPGKPTSSVPNPHMYTVTPVNNTSNSNVKKNVYSSINPASQTSYNSKILSSSSPSSQSQPSPKKAPPNLSKYKLISQN